MLFLLAVLDVLDLSVDDGIQAVLGGGWHVVSLFGHEFVPQCNFISLLSSHFVVDLCCYLLWLEILHRLNTVNYSVVALCSLHYIFSNSVGLVTQVGSFDLVLSLFVSWRSLLD